MNSIIGVNSVIDESVVIGNFNCIGCISHEKDNVTEIGKNCIIENYVVIGSGVKIMNDCFIEDYCKVGNNVNISAFARVLYGSKLYDGVFVGTSAIIGGFVCENAVIGDFSRVFGKIIHSQHRPELEWDNTIEKSPILGRNVFVGFDAMIIGDIVVNDGAYIAAGAIVTKDIPENSFVYGVNKVVKKSNWIGKLNQ